MTNNRNELKEKLKAKLREIFQFENQDLDFGIYRILNYKRKEIEDFIEKELIEEIRKQLELVSGEEINEVKKEFDEIIQKIKEDFGEGAFVNGELKKKFENTPLGKKYYEKKKQLEEIKISEDLEREIYNHIINFFSRYYDKGDFISRRRYGKNEKYTVPYNGEEVLLYWANKDQYYVKTTEYFRKYTFEVKNKGLKVNFRVIDAEEEKGNIKSPEKKFFVLNEKFFDFDKEKNELDIYFEYRGLTKEEEEEYKHGQSASQDRINEKIVSVLEEKIPENSFARLIFEKEGEKKLIEKHLYRYTRRNTTDYFIHKDLKGFLERELDFYIKNEFLNLDDLKVLEESGYFEKLRFYMIGVEAFRRIALKIIEFLAQIENFQKKLWEKKKFVIDTHYVITLDKIKEYAGKKFLESILDEILKNKKQLEEWKELFGIEAKTKEDLIENNEKLKFDGEEWKKLPIDTKYFDEEFKWELLAALSKNNDLDEILDGVLIKSENWQALNLLLNKYYEKVQTIYIDPPFNKENEADYLYKVGYKDATWITMLENRIGLGRDFLNERGSIFVRCDYNGNMYVRMLLNEIFGKENFRNEIQISRTKKIFTGVKGYNVATDSLFFFTKNEVFKFYAQYKQRTGEQKWINMHSPGERRPPERIIFGRVFYPPEGRHWTFIQKTIDKMIEEGRIRIKEDVEYVDLMGNKTKGMPQYLTSEQELLDSNWTDIQGYSQTQGFPTENSEILLKRVIKSTSNEGDIVIDFFLGSGTTTAVAHKLRRKWLGVEMGEHFYTVILPRMKKVLAYDKSGISKEKNVKEKYNEKNAGSFFKYHTLEQYEDALENIGFEDQTENQKKLLFELPDYFVKYMLEWETKNSKTFLI